MGEDENKSLDRLLLAIYICILFAGAISIIAYKYFPTQDGPEHLFYVETLKKVMAGDSFYSGLIQVNERFVANAMFDDLTRVLSGIMDPIGAQKLLIFVTFLFLNISFMFLLREFSRDRIKVLGIGILFVPLSFSFCLSKGFLNFYLSLAFMIFSLFLFLKYCRRKSWIAGIMFMISSFLVFYAHLIGWMIYLFILFCMIVIRYVSDKQNKKEIDFTSVKLFVAASIIPAILMVGYVYGILSARLANTAVQDIFANSYYSYDFKGYLLNNAYSLFQNLGFGSLSSIMTSVIIITLIVSLFLFASRKDMFSPYSYVAIAGILLLVFIAIPVVILDWYYLKQRFWMPFVIIFLISISQIKLNQKGKNAIVLFCVLSAIVLMIAVQHEIYNDARQVEDSMKELEKINIPENSTILPFFSEISQKHILGYYCIEHRCLAQNSLFMEPDTFMAGFRKNMPHPQSDNGLDLDQSYLQYDYYFFNGDYYLDYQARADELGLKTIYQSDQWKVYTQKSP